MDEYYRDRRRGKKVFFDPLGQGFYDPQGIYKDIDDVKVPPEHASSRGGMKACIAVLCIVIVFALVAAGIVLAIFLSQGKWMTRFLSTFSVHQQKV